MLICITALTIACAVLLANMFQGPKPVYMKICGVDSEEHPRQRNVYLKGTARAALSNYCHHAILGPAKHAYHHS